MDKETIQEALVSLQKVAWEVEGMLGRGEIEEEEFEELWNDVCKAKDVLLR